MWLSAGTLYRTIQRLLEDGLITEPRVTAIVDPRRRPYRITAFGRAVAQARPTASLNSSAWLRAQDTAEDDVIEYRALSSTLLPDGIPPRIPAME